MSEQPMLPGMPEPTAPASPPTLLSADARLTAKQRELAEGGIFHPLTIALNGTLRQHPHAGDHGRTCGNCKHRADVGPPDHARARPRCLIEKGPYTRSMNDAIPDCYPRVSFGNATQVRAWWPGCIDHEFGDAAVGPDAARYVPAAAGTDE